MVQEGDNYNLVLRVTPIYNGQDLETKEILPKEYIWDLSGERTSGIRVRTARSQFD